MGKDHRVRTEEELKVEARLNRKRGPKKKQLGNMATNEDAKTDEEETDEGSDNDVESLDDCEPSTDAKYKFETMNPITFVCFMKSLHLFIVIP